jgi:2-polyprenyl-6-methoxyphenol hydroxylase-like FAD-dependent oxidoreductase
VPSGCAIIAAVAGSRSALVVGAGIGGLAASLALKQCGWHVRVFERADSPRELGFALLLAPNAIAALKELGLAGPVVAASAIPTSAEVRQPDGRVLRRLDIGDSQRAIGGVPVVALRTVLHGALLDAVGRDALTLGAEITGVSAAGSHPSVTLASGETVTADLVVGADGVQSAIRRSLHPSEPPPRASGLRALRGVVSGTSHHLGAMAGTVYFGRGLEAAIVKAGPDVVYFYVSLRDDLVADIPKDPPRFLSRALEILDPHFAAVAGSTPPEDMRIDDLFDRDPLPYWGTHQVTLLGDAAHPLLPHTGQGAAQALEDAVALRRVLSHERHIPDALRHYERVRAKRTTALLFQGRRYARAMRTTNPLACRARDTAVRLVPRWMIVSSFVMGQRSDPYEGL